MPLLVGIIAKIMALVEAVLDNWVSATAVGAPDPCTGIYAITTHMTDCGTQFAGDIAQVVVAITAMIPHVLSGLAANVS
jgi:hypothetical protein